MQAHRPSLILLAATLSLTPCLAGPALGAGPAAGPPPLPPELEMRLALSALPPHLRDDATVYTLDPASGFRVARPGSNGFHALVARNDPGIYQGEWTHREWADLLIPVAFDAAGAESNMKPYFELAALRAEGVEPEAAQRTLRESYRTRYKAPERTGIAYMLAPVVRGYRRSEEGPEIVTFSLPHYMFYAPGVRGEDIGAGPNFDHPFVLSRKPGPHGLIIVLAGREERRAIREEFADLLAALCAHDPQLCLPDAAGKPKP